MRSETQKRKDRIFQTIKITDAYEGANFFKSISHPIRFSIIKELGSNSGINLDQLAERLEVDPTILPFHTHKLSSTGIILRKQRANFSYHFLTRRGKVLYRFIKEIERGVRITN